MKKRAVCALAFAGAIVAVPAGVGHAAAPQARYAAHPQADQLCSRNKPKNYSRRGGPSTGRPNMSSPNSPYRTTGSANSAGGARRRGGPSTGRPNMSSPNSPYRTGGMVGQTLAGTATPTSASKRISGTCTSKRRNMIASLGA